jgi:hypothetical protein
MTLSQSIKRVAKAHGVKVLTKKHGSIIRVTVLTRCLDSALDAIQALETVEAHGDMMNDTRWYSGISITFRFEVPLIDSDHSLVSEILRSWDGQIKRDLTNTDKVSTEYHIRNEILKRLGRAVGASYLDKYHLWDTLENIRSTKETKEINR